jgi:hypothetical protein
MKCQEFWKTQPENGIAHSHLVDCAECAMRMRQYEHLSAGMRAMAASQSHIEAPLRVEARLVAAFRTNAGNPVPIHSRRRWIPAATWAAAIAAMIAAGVFVVRVREPEARRPVPRQVELAVTESGGNSLEAAVEEGFLPLPGAAQLTPADDVNVVHVELPRSAMMQVGIEVGPDRADETVHADVMVGADGLARAVRFVDVTGSD